MPRNALSEVGKSTPPHVRPTAAVNSYNEWDPLEEVIVGIAEGAIVPPWDAVTKATMPAHAEWFFRKHGGLSFPQEMIEKASEELDGRDVAGGGVSLSLAVGGA